MQLRICRHGKRRPGECKHGNILTDNLGQMVKAAQQRRFGQNKENSFPRWCRECEVLAACQGGCPKHRFAQSHYGEPGCIISVQVTGNLSAIFANTFEPWLPCWKTDTPPPS